MKKIWMKTNWMRVEGLYGVSPSNIRVGLYAIFAVTNLSVLLALTLTLTLTLTLALALARTLVMALA